MLEAKIIKTNTYCKQQAVDMGMQRVRISLLINLVVRLAVACSLL